MPTKPESNWPFFSIITVTLNPGKSDLLKTIKSIINQKFHNWELIIKDGGSKDGSLACLPDDERIKIIHKKDTGIFEAMNQAMKHSKGVFINFLNAGDYYYDQNSLSVVYEAHAQCFEADFLYGNVRKPYARSGYELYPARLTRFYLFNQMICHQAWFVKRSYYIYNGDYETLQPSGADDRFLLRMLLRNNITYHHIPKVLVTYKGDGISQSPQNLFTAEKWIDEQRKQLFKKTEYNMFSILWFIWRIFKPVFYDRFFFRIWRPIQKTRAFKYNRTIV